VISAQYILKLCESAAQLFESSEVGVKRQLLKAVLQNCYVEGKKLVPEYKEPFNVFVEVKNDKWCPGMDSNHHEVAPTSPSS